MYKLYAHFAYIIITAKTIQLRHVLQSNGEGGRNGLGNTVKNIAVMLAVFSGSVFSQADDNTQKAFIKTMVGNVEVSSAVSAKWRPARAGMMVKMGCNIRTYIESSADIEIETGTVLRIGENSVVTLAKMIKDKDANVTSSNVKLGTGQIWANVKKLTNTKSEFEFETPTAVASIRGTKLGLSVDKSGTQLDVYEGLVMVRPRGGAGREVGVSTRNRAIIGDASHAIQVIQFTEKDTVKGQKAMKDPFSVDTTKGKNSNQVDTAGHSSVDSASLKSLALDILQPQANAVSKENQFLVKGKTVPGATVDIGGKDVVVDKLGMFSLLMDLTLGKNAFSVAAKLGSASKSIDCQVEYHPQLSMNVTSIVDNMEVTSSDIVADVDLSDGAKFSVNDKEGQTKVTLVPGKNTIIVKAWDQWNTTIQRSYIVTYTKTGTFSLKVALPVDLSSVTAPMIPVSGSTTPGAKVTVNGSPVVVSASGFFSYTLPIPDEAQEYTVKIDSRLGDDEATEERGVYYSPPKPPLTLLVTAPIDGQIIKQNLLHITGKTTARAKVNVNSRLITVTSGGTFTYDIPVSEKDIGDNYSLDIEASDDSTDITKLINVKIDVTSPQINTSVPIMSPIPMLEGFPATKNNRMNALVTDKTPDDQLTLVIINNGAREEMSFNSGDQQYFNLEDGKNVYSIKAYDLAKNPSDRMISGTIYYLPGPLSIDVIEPSSASMTVDDLPPMPRMVSGKEYVSQMTLRVEVDDGIHTVPESIKFVQVEGQSFTKQLIDKGNYVYEVNNIPLVRGINSFQIVAQDIANNIVRKPYSVTIK